MKSSPADGPSRTSEERFLYSFCSNLSAFIGVHRGPTLRCVVIERMFEGNVTERDDQHTTESVAHSKPTAANRDGLHANLSTNDAYVESDSVENTENIVHSKPSATNANRDGLDANSSINDSFVQPDIVETTENIAHSKTAATIANRIENCRVTRRKISEKNLEQNKMEGIFECFECHRKFSVLRSLRKHRARAHSGNILECESCGKQFKHRDNLNQHKMTHLLRSTKKKGKRIRRKGPISFANSVILNSQKLRV